MPKTETKNATQRNWKSAPTPGGNFVQLPISAVVEGTMTGARMEMEEMKGKKNKGQKKERYYFEIALAQPTKLLVGSILKKTQKEKQFQAGEIVTLPDHGYLISTMRRTACEIKNVSFDQDSETDLSVLVGKEFRIERLEDGEISSGQFAGKPSALYDVKYEAPVAA